MARPTAMERWQAGIMPGLASIPQSVQHGIDVLDARQKLQAQMEQQTAEREASQRYGTSERVAGQEYQTGEKTTAWNRKLFGVEAEAGVQPEEPDFEAADRQAAARGRVLSPQERSTLATMHAARRMKLIQARRTSIEKMLQEHDKQIVDLGTAAVDNPGLRKSLVARRNMLAGVLARGGDYTVPELPPLVSGKSRALPRSLSVRTPPGTDINKTVLNMQKVMQDRIDGLREEAAQLTRQKLFVGVGSGTTPEQRAAQAAALDAKLAENAQAQVRLERDMNDVPKQFGLAVQGALIGGQRVNPAALPAEELTLEEAAYQEYLRTGVIPEVQ